MTKRYQLTCLVTGQVTMCEKITIDGKDYYCRELGITEHSDINGTIVESLKIKVKGLEKRLIATTNTSIPCLQVVDYVEEFKKGDYIVCLKKESDRQHYIKPNFILKQYEDRGLAYAEICLDGTRCLFDEIKFNDLNATWRYAEPEEIAEYDRLGKPYDVTTLKKDTKLTKDDLVQGKIYYTVYKDRKFLFKRGFNYILRLYSKDILTHQFRVTAEYIYQEANPEQVKHFEACVKAGKYVKPDEMEEIKPWSIGTYVVALKDKAVGIGKWSRGDIAKVDTNSRIDIKGDNNWFCNAKHEENGLVKWFAALKEAEEFSKTLIEVESIPEYVECVVAKGWNGYLKIGTIYDTNIQVHNTTWKES